MISCYFSLFDQKKSIDRTDRGWSNAIGNLFSTRLIFYSIIAIDSSYILLKIKIQKESNLN